MSVTTYARGNGRVVSESMDGGGQVASCQKGGRK